MTAARFDELAREIARATSRRRALKALAAGIGTIGAGAVLGSVWPGGREADAANTHLCCVYTCQSTPFEPVTLKATCTPVDITRKEFPTCPPDYQGCILSKPSITSKCSDCGSLT